MFDLDGVVTVGGVAVVGAVENINAAADAGAHLAYVTNNASRPPERVAAMLAGFGLPATAKDVVTSAQAAAALAVRSYGAGARVALLGGDGLRTAAAEAGLVAEDDWDQAVVLLSGYGPDVSWHQIRDAARLVRNGLPYIASNTDGSMMTPQGVAPGHGVLVDMICRFAGREAVVAGKPSPPLLRETIARVGGNRPLMVGDRLDTDIEGAAAVGVDSLLVMTGVSDVAALLAAPPHARPSYVSGNLSGLNEAHAAPTTGADGSARLGGWRASVEGGELVLDGDGSLDDRLRVLASAAWAWRDRQGEVPGTSAVLGPVVEAVVEVGDEVGASPVGEDR